MTQGIYRREPLFLAVCSRETFDATEIKERLRSFFSVPPDELISLESSRLGAFYAPGYFEPLVGNFVNNHDGVMTATSYPILDEECAHDLDHGLTRFFGRIHTGKSDIGEFPAPFAIFQVKEKNESIVCYNDAFGAGRVYYSHENDLTVISNSISAVALARGVQSESDENYWSPYYCGGPVGHSTFIRGIHLAPCGSRIVIKPGAFSLQHTPLGTRLLEGSRRKDSDEAVLDSLLSPLRVLTDRTDLPRPTIGISGGRDSRLVVALALQAGLEASFETWFPPALETQVATELVTRLSREIDWKSIDRRKVHSEQPTGDLHSRARNWFTFTGGDNWSTFIRRAAPDVNFSSQTRPEFSISGMGGEVTRGSLYLEAEVLTDNAQPALRRFINRSLKYWPLVPPEIREHSRAQNQEALLESFIQGFTGFKALDLTEMSTNYRRSIPPPNPGIVPVLFNLDLAQLAIEASPMERFRSKTLRDLTERLVPEWRGVPYYHEVASKRDEPSDNKVSIHPTHWETDRGDFLDSMDAALRITDFSGLNIATVEREIDAPSDGRNRTNALFEAILWHAAAEEEIRSINRLLRKG